MKLPPRESQERKDLTDFVCLLRYKTKQPSPKSSSYITFDQIKSIVGYSERTIGDLCQERIQDQHYVKRTLRRNQVEYYIKRTRRDRRKKVTLALKKLATKEETL